MMPWVRLDDHFDEHPKIAQLSDAALALWVSGLAYCNRNLTDGFIPHKIGIGALRWCDGNAIPPIRELEAAGLWEQQSGGWYVHDYPDYQPSKADVLREREMSRRRQETWYDKHKRKKPNAKPNAVTNAQPNANLTGAPVPVPSGLVKASTESAESLPESGLPRLSHASKNGKEPDGFDRLWDAYPRHTARAKAVDAFRRLAPDEATLCAILAGVKRSMKNPQWQRDGGQFIPYLATWLNQRRWEDEETRSTTGPTLEGFADEEYAALERMHL